ncbi:hypothetical protein AAG570_007252 [Ranatra chinensis]|uniref:Protein CASC3 n=1 Tax=Ranatra chinensis TaxID=642074 RepID=A0ABD0XVC5_9HEMI
MLKMADASGAAPGESQVGGGPSGEETPEVRQPPAVEAPGGPGRETTASKETVAEVASEDSEYDTLEEDNVDDKEVAVVAAVQDAPVSEGEPDKPAVEKPPAPAAAESEPAVERPPTPEAAKSEPAVEEPPAPEAVESEPTTEKPPPLEEPTEVGTEPSEMVGVGEVTSAPEELPTLDKVEDKSGDAPVEVANGGGDTPDSSLSADAVKEALASGDEDLNASDQSGVVEADSSNKDDEEDLDDEEDEYYDDEEDDVEEDPDDAELLDDEGKEDGRRRPRISETTTGSGDAIGERPDGDGQESNKEKKPLDHDEDRRDPQYIPKKGIFYEHDDRTSEALQELLLEKVYLPLVLLDVNYDRDGSGEDADLQKPVRTNGLGAIDDRPRPEDCIDIVAEECSEGAKDAGGPAPGGGVSRGAAQPAAPGAKPAREPPTERWLHDLYDEVAQSPKMTQELIDIYGYDIRNEDSPPKARRRRRYGRGPTKYTRNWEDETAYSKKRGGGGAGRGFTPHKEDFPSLQDSEDKYPVGRGSGRGRGRGGARHGRGGAGQGAPRTPREEAPTHAPPPKESEEVGKKQATPPEEHTEERHQPQPAAEHAKNTQKGQQTTKTLRLPIGHPSTKTRASSEGATGQPPAGPHPFQKGGGEGGGARMAYMGRGRSRNQEFAPPFHHQQPRKQHHSAQQQFKSKSERDEEDIAALSKQFADAVINVGRSGAPQPLVLRGSSAPPAESQAQSSGIVIEKVEVVYAGNQQQQVNYAHQAEQHQQAGQQGSGQQQQGRSKRYSTQRQRSLPQPSHGGQVAPQSQTVAVQHQPQPLMAQPPPSQPPMTQPPPPQPQMVQQPPMTQPQIAQPPLPPQPHMAQPPPPQYMTTHPQQPQLPPQHFYQQTPPPPPHHVGGGYVHDGGPPGGAPPPPMVAFLPGAPPPPGPQVTGPPPPINYVSAHHYHHHPMAMAPVQQPPPQTMVVTGTAGGLGGGPASATELYTGQGGITYYNTQNQMVQPVSQSRRIKVAIPIVIPPQSPKQKQLPAQLIKIVYVCTGCAESERKPPPTVSQRPRKKNGIFDPTHHHHHRPPPLRSPPIRAGFRKAPPARAGSSEPEVLLSAGRTVLATGPDAVVVSVCDGHAEGPGFDSLRGQSWLKARLHQGASRIVRRVLDRKDWILSVFDFMAEPHSSILYRRLDSRRSQNEGQDEDVLYGAGSMRPNMTASPTGHQTSKKPPADIR